MRDSEIDISFADPPYNRGIDYGEGTNDSRFDYESWCKQWFFELQKVSCTVLITPGTQNLSMWYRIAEPYWLCSWRKPNATLSHKKVQLVTWEPIIVYTKQDIKLRRDSYNVNIIVQKDTGNHPCPKPLRLIEFLLSDFVGNYIYDPFLGSGTTAVAAERLGRNWIGSEINPEYCKIAQKRIDNERAQMKLFTQAI